MRLLVLVILGLVLTSTAWADSSIQSAPGDDAAFDPTKCKMSDGPLLRDRNAADIKKLTRQGLWLRQGAGQRHLLFSASRSDGPNRSVVIERATRKTVMTLDEPTPATALVEDKSGKLLGILALRELDPAKKPWRFPVHIMLYGPSGKAAWTVHPTIAQRGHDSAATLVVGDLLIVASFLRVFAGGGNGSSLAAFDLKTGTLRWTADVQQLNVPHNFWNDISLHLSGQTVVMRGFEAAGCYQQIFDLATGKRLSAVMPKTPKTLW